MPDHDYETCQGCDDEDCLANRLMVWNWDKRPTIHVQKPDKEYYRSKKEIVPYRLPNLKWQPLPSYGGQLPVYGVGATDVGTRYEKEKTIVAGINIPAIFPIEVQRVALLQKRDSRSCRFVNDGDESAEILVPSGNSFVGPYCSENGCQLSVINVSRQSMNLELTEEKRYFGFLIDSISRPWIPVAVRGNPKQIIIPAYASREVYIVPADPSITYTRTSWDSYAVSTNKLGDTARREFGPEERDGLPTSGRFSLCLGAMYNPPGLVTADNFKDGKVQLYNLSNGAITLQFDSGEEGVGNDFLGYVNPYDFHTSVEKLTILDLRRSIAGTRIELLSSVEKTIKARSYSKVAIKTVGIRAHEDSEYVRYARVMSSVVGLIPTVTILKPGDESVHLFNATGNPVQIKKNDTVAHVLVSTCCKIVAADHKGDLTTAARDVE